MESGETDHIISDTFSALTEQRQYVSEGCQVNFIPKNELNRTFICNRYKENNVCEVEIQTEISDIEEIKKPAAVITHKKQFKSVSCGTPTKQFISKGVGCNTYE